MRYNYLHLTVLTTLILLAILLLVAKSLISNVAQKREVEAFLREQQAAALFEVPALPAVFSCEIPTAPEILPQYRALHAQNSDLVGWVRVEGTPLDAPVMYTPQDGEYYLRRFFDRSDNQYGTPFLDARCTVAPPSSNLILHGHNMNDSKMFGTLPLYTQKAYFDAHPVIGFDTLYETANYQIVSAFLSVYDENDESPTLYYAYTDLREEAEMAAFSDTIKGLSLYDTGFTLVPGDEVITLITCSYHATNGRMTVVAKKIPQNEVSQEQMEEQT